MATREQLLAEAKALADKAQRGVQTLIDKGYGKTDIKSLPQDVDVANLPSLNDTRTSALPQERPSAQLPQGTSNNLVNLYDALNTATDLARQKRNKLITSTLGASFGSAIRPGDMGSVLDSVNAQSERTLQTILTLDDKHAKLMPSIASGIAAQIMTDPTLNTPEYFQKWADDYGYDPRTLEIMVAGEREKLKKEKMIGDLDLEYKRAQIAGEKADTAKTYADIGKIKAETGGGGAGATFVSGVGGATQVNPDLITYAQQYASTGKLPIVSELKNSNLTAGQVAEIAKALPKPEGALVDRNTGVKPTSLSAAQESGLIAMAEIVQKTLPDLQNRFGKLLYAGDFVLLYDTQTRTDYKTFRQDFLSKLLVARSGAAVTEQEYARYAAMVPKDTKKFNGAKILNALASSMKTNLDNTLNSSQISIYGYSTVNLGGKEYKVGQDVVVNGVRGRVLPDGSIYTQ